ncbi:Pyridoxamine 5'-phosphate oxidase family protein [uncultured Desulfatiglans sp.]|nr:Pyridoxamine 5'-phosphate oxidase family protein [uncultured Desulfatiglans sp.]
MKNEKQKAPGTAQLTAMAEELIRSRSTMTLATGGDSGPWAAPVYYACLEGSFYFFSSPESRHIQESLPDKGAAAAIFAESDSWQGIRGLQMSGRIFHIRAGFKAFKGLQAYMRKFAFTREFFTPGKRIDLDAFSERFRVRFYAFKPDLIYYLDNSIAFGFKETVTL